MTLVSEVLLGREKKLESVSQSGITADAEMASQSSNGTRAAHRRFLAEGALQSRPALSTPAPDWKIEQDLANLNTNPAYLNVLMNDIGGAQNISFYRTSQGFSLADLCGGFGNNGLPLTTALQTLLQNNFQFVGNDLSPRYQCDSNHGYCGEASLISAGLANGVYMSQYEAREEVFGDQTDDQVLVGQDSAAELAAYMGLSTESWQPEPGQATTANFLAWVSKEVNSGHPVSMGVYMNMPKFGEGGRGDNQYDHIVMVTGIDLAKGTITFSDNGLYGDNDSDSQYSYTYSLNDCIGTRDQANQSANLYTIPLFNNDSRYQDCGIAVTGRTDSSLPIHLFPNVNQEPDIEDGSNQIPPGAPMTLTGCVTGMVPGEPITLKIHTSLGDETITIPASANGVFSISEINGMPITTDTTVVCTASQG